MKLNTIRFKISILYVVVLGFILVSYSALMYFSLRHMLFQERDIKLEGKADEVASLIRFYTDTLGHGHTSFISALEKTINMEKNGPGVVEVSLSTVEAQWLKNIDQYDLRKDFVNISDKNETPIRFTEDFPAGLLSLFIKNLEPFVRGRFSFKNVSFQENNLRVISKSYDFGNSQECIIQIGTSLTSTMRILHGRLISIAISIPVILLIASFLGQIFAMRILKPVFDITKTADKITHEDLSARVIAEHADEEIKYLAQAFNDMIARLEKSFKYIADFGSHVAHELKTPLAIIRGESQVALKHARNAEEYKRVIQVNLEEAERMIKVVEDMLLLTKLEYESQVFKFEPLDLVDFLKDVSGQSALLASKKQITVKMDEPKEPVSIYGDGVHLRRLFLNLIDNAIKFSPVKSKINIKLIKNERVNVSISDQGFGIANEDLPNIFEKFFHKDYETNGQSSSVGLGLSMALSIAKAHGGTIQVESELKKGSTFTVILPFNHP